ncbi:MAG: DivIVA domain-containing protein [Candidatus Hydrogenedentes bacterium]|nr:DivIVA domain-containing protein [Candidatus Hydrogenedentota bacterium]
MRKDDKVVTEVLGDEHAVTPSDIFGKQFKRRSFGGYDPKDVDDFLERVADALENLIVQVRVLKDKNDEQRKSLQEFRDLEGALRGALVASQQLGDDMRDSAKREAHVMLEEAKLKKAQAQLEASRIPSALTRDIHILEQQRSRLRIEMLAILETHRKLIDSLLPEDAMQMPTSFFEVGQQEPQLPRSTPASLSAPSMETPPPEQPEELVSGAVPQDTAGPAPEESMQPQREDRDSILDAVDEFVLDGPPVREDAEDFPEEPIR